MASPGGQAGLFSAVTSTFIVDLRDTLDIAYPDPTIVRILSILYSSLALSIFAAFVAMLGKQWLNRYSADIHGSLIDRSRDRQRKMNGMVTWRFNIVMEGLPLMLQAALLLLGCALYTYLSLIDTTLAWAIASFIAVGLLFYGLIVIAATISYDCPFQTPPSIIFHFMVRLDNRHGGYLKRFRRWIRRTFSWGGRGRSGFDEPDECQRPTGGSHWDKRRRWSPEFDGPGGPWSYPVGGSGLDGPGKNKLGGRTELAWFGPFHDPAAFFDEDNNWGGHVLDSNCIAWMFEMPMGADAALDIMEFIPDVVWHSGIRTTPLERLYDTVLECCDHSSGRPVVISKLKRKAYLSAKALLHITIQRKCIGRESDNTVFDSISSRHRNLGSERYRGDSDLESALGIVDRIFNPHGFERMPWNEFSFTDSHHAWMGRTLLYRAWYVLRMGEHLPDDIKGLVIYSLRMEPLPPASTVIHCLLIIGMVLGINLDVGDRKTTDDRSVELI